MSLTRRSILSGMSILSCQLALPVWAQAIGRQSDPYAQVDPYDDPRNGFPAAQRPAATPSGPSHGQGVFDTRAPAAMDSADQDAMPAFARMVIEDGGGLYPDPSIQRAINDFIAPFTHVSDRSHLKWQAVVSRSAQVNAWTVGGGKICIHPGLLRSLTNAGELAAVICHEIGHVDYGHVDERMRLLETLTLADQSRLRRAVPGVRDARTGKPVMVGDVVIASYSRQQEDQADAHSMVLLDRAGWDPRWAMQLMERFVRMDLRQGHHGATNLTDDHPSAAERLARLRQQYGVGRSGTDAASPPPSTASWTVLKTAFPS